MNRFRNILVLGLLALFTMGSVVAPAVHYGVHKARAAASEAPGPDDYPYLTKEVQSIDCLLCATLVFWDLPPQDQASALLAPQEDIPFIQAPVHDLQPFSSAQPRAPPVLT